MVKSYLVEFILDLLPLEELSSHFIQTPVVRAIPKILK